MAISYNQLWKQLIDHSWSQTDMIHRAGMQYRRRDGIYP